MARNRRRQRAGRAVVRGSGRTLRVLTPLTAYSEMHGACRARSAAKHVIDEAGVRRRTARSTSCAAMFATPVECLVPSRDATLALYL
jgi:hypothetical protein